MNSATLHFTVRGADMDDLAKAAYKRASELAGDGWALIPGSHPVTSKYPAEQVEKEYVTYADTQRYEVAGEFIAYYQRIAA